MAKFDGVLLASDWDGTLCVNGNISDENIRSIKYFQENGGKFTICSGRYYEYLRQYSDKVDVNTYTICYNGGYIVNNKTNEVLYQGFCDDYLFELLDKILSENPPHKTITVFDNESFVPPEYSLNEFKAKFSEIKTKQIYKILLRADNPTTAKEWAKRINDFELRDYIAVQSWEISLEILKKENAKGAAIRRVAEAEGCTLIVAVGDYENDITMLTEADIGYAVADAASTLIPYADRITVSAKDSAISKVIEDIEKELKSKRG